MTASEQDDAVKINAAPVIPTALNLNQQLTVETETVPAVPTLNVASSSSSVNGAVRNRRSQDSVPRVSLTRQAAKRRSQRLAQGSKADIFAAKVANAVDEQNPSEDDEEFVYDTQQPNDQIRRPYVRSKSNASLPASKHASFYQQHKKIPSGASGVPTTSHDSYLSDEQAFESENESQLDSEVPLSPIAKFANRNFVVPKSPGPRKSLVSLNLDDSDLLKLGVDDARPPFSRLETDRSMDTQDDKDREDPDRDIQWPRIMHNNQRASRSKQSFAPSPLKDLNDSMRAKHSYLQRWRVPTQSPDNFSDGDPDETSSLMKFYPNMLNYQSRSINNKSQRKSQKYPPSSKSSNSLMSRNTRPFLAENGDSDLSSNLSYRTPSLATRFLLCSSVLLIFMFSIAFVVGFTVAALRPLQDFDVLSMSDVLVSDRELVFSLIMHGRNPSIFATRISACNLDIFATSAYINAQHYSSEVHIELTTEDFEANLAIEQSHDSSSHTRTLLLGTIYQFDSPVEFWGGISNGMQWRTGVTKLVDPLKSNATIWSEISEHEFDLNVKGVVSYLVFGRNYSLPVSVSYKVAADALL